MTDEAWQRLEARVDKLEEKIEKKLDEFDEALHRLAVQTALLDSRARIWAAFASFIVGLMIAYLVEMRFGK